MRAGTDTDDEAAATQHVQVLPRENDLRQFFRMSGFSGNPEKYAYTHYQSLLGNTEWVSVLVVWQFTPARVGTFDIASCNSGLDRYRVKKTTEQGVRPWYIISNWN